MTFLHPLACVDPGARIGCDVSIGPFCVIEAGVRIGDGCQLASHVVLKQGTTLGRNNRILERAVLGGPPQHLGAGAEQGRLTIGDNNQIRECVTIHRGLRPQDVTQVGNDCLIMVNSHIGHDCLVGNRVIITNNAMIAGHVTIEDGAYLSAAVGIHQFCRVGRLAMVGGVARVVKDVPPYFTMDGGTSLLVGVNRIGLRRSGFSVAQIAQVKAAYRLIYRSGLAWTEILEALQREYPTGPVAHLHRFLAESKRGFSQERRAATAATVRLRTDLMENLPREARKAG